MIEWLEFGLAVQPPGLPLDRPHADLALDRADLFRDERPQRLGAEHVAWRLRLNRAFDVRRARRRKLT